MKNYNGHFWKIRSTQSIVDSLIYLGVHTDYIDYLMRGDTEYIIKYEYFMIYFSYSNRGFYLSRYNSEYHEYMVNAHNYKYICEINLRKEKLLKINEKYNEEILESEV